MCDENSSDVKRDVEYEPSLRLAALIDEVESQAKAEGFRGIAYEVLKAGHAMELAVAKVGRLVSRSPG